MDIAIDDQEFVDATKDTLEKVVKNATSFHFYWEVCAIRNTTVLMIVRTVVNAIIELENVNVMSIEMEMIVLNFFVVDKSIV